MTCAVEMRGIHKRFGQTVANDDINLKVETGHIHAVLGENGAGKTTLMRILYGEDQPDRGTIHINGEEVVLHSPAVAISLGIGLIHQHFMLINDFSIAENFSLGNEPHKLGVFCDYRQIEDKASAILDSLGIPLPLNTPVGRFSVEEQQIIEIGKALYRGADILVLDEPTSVLTPQKIQNLLDNLVQLKQEGKTIVLITHKLEEALAVADEISVLRKGRLIATVDRADADKDRLVQLMVGEGSLHSVARKQASYGEALVSVEGLSVAARGRTIVDNASFTIRRGEIYGLTGVGGNGQAELVEAMVGLRTPQEGTIRLQGEEIQTWDMRRRRKLGMAYVPENRMLRGSAPALSILDNIIMGHHRRDALSRGLRLDAGRAQAFSRKLLKDFDVVAGSEADEAGSLSGGNLQKVILAREFSFDADFMIVAYPSQGIDIRTTSFVHAELLRRRDAGCAILLVTGDLEEVLSLSDRIGVLYRGELVVETAPEETSRMELGQYMTGVKTAVKEG